MQSDIKYLDITSGRTREALIESFNYEYCCWKYICFFLKLNFDELNIDKKQTRFLFSPDFSDDVYEIYFAI